jgi:hypothetical protein
MVNKNCLSCGNSSRRHGKYVCVTEDVVDINHVCDGWVKPCYSGTAFCAAINRASKRLKQPDWQISEVKIMKNYRKVEVENDLD